MYRKRVVQWLIMLIGVVVLAACQPVMAQPLQLDEVQVENNKAGILRFEVAEDGNRFVFSKERLFEDGMPQYGTPFVTQGSLYPEGTLNGTNGVLANSQPEFPNQVIGEWTCYGWMIGDGRHTTTGEWVVSTQIHKFNEEHGGGMLITDGYEISDLNVLMTRAITCGTGEFQDVKGNQMQTLLGFTEKMGVNLSVELQVDQSESV